MLTLLKPCFKITFLNIGLMLFLNCSISVHSASFLQNSTERNFDELYSSAEDLENLTVDFYDHSQHFMKTRRSEDVIPTQTPPPYSTSTIESTTGATIDEMSSPMSTTSDPSEEASDSMEGSALSIPGEPGVDYPIYNEIPSTDFDCQKQRYKGFFADLQTNCQAWHYCDIVSDTMSTFLCPNGTLFSQVLLTCDWWFNVNCQESRQLYVLNERLYRYVQVPKPTFPEDFFGPEVDLWLKRQLQLGLLPKTKKNLKTKITNEDENEKIN